MRARLAAANITSVGATTPVHSSKASAPWKISIGNPPSVAIPSLAASARNGVTSGVYTMSTASAPSRAVERSHGNALSVPPPCIPNDVQFTMQSYSPSATSLATALTWPVANGATSPASRSARAPVRFAMSIRPAPASASANAIPRAATTSG